MVLKSISPSKWISFIMVVVVGIVFANVQSYQPSETAGYVQPAKESTPQQSGVAPPVHSQPQIKSVMLNLTQQAWIDKVKEQPLLDLDHESQFQTVEVTATGYYAGKESTGKEPGQPEYGITYSGVKVLRAGYSTIAADPKVFPLGTILWIPGYGYGVVADIGSAIKGNIIDLYFATKDQVFNEWGKKKVNVMIIEKGNGKVTESMLNRLNHPVISTKA